MEPQLIKHRFKIRSKFQSDFPVVLGPFLITFESTLKTLDPQKWCSRVGAVLFLRKSRLSNQIWFGIDFLWFLMLLERFLGSLLGSKSHPELDQKSMQMFDRFLMDFGSQFGSIWAQFWLPKSIKNEGRFLYEKGDGYHDAWGPISESPKSRGGVQGGP